MSVVFDDGGETDRREKDGQARDDPQHGADEHEEQVHARVICQIRRAEPRSLAPGLRFGGARLDGG